MRMLTLLFLFSLVSVGYAQEPPAEPFYAGFSVATMRYKEDMTVIDPELASFKDSTTAWKIYGGYLFNDHFGLEASYIKSDDSSGSASGNNSIDGDFSLGAKADFRGYSLKAMGFLPTSWGKLYAGVGFYDNRSDLSFTASFDNGESEFIRSTDHFSDITTQVGAEWDLDYVVLRGEYEWWDFREGGASVLGLGLQWKF